ncbi:hypothetical protein TNCV_4675821 [Trichonephila clavipes]|nr:hypothetical protein TNCV_4675821 [Trichonephila clavipes]
MKTSSVEFISRSPNPLPMKNSPLVSMEIPLRTALSEWPLWHAAKAKQSSRAGSKPKLKLLDIRTERAERERRTREVREQALPSEYHRQTYL